jgi:hypothetical protein
VQVAGDSYILWLYNNFYRFAGLPGTSYGNLKYTVGIISALKIPGIIGEFRFRKRHQRLHHPIIKRIDRLITELRSDGDIM